MIDQQVLSFALIAGLLTVTPGADTMLVVRNVSGRGRNAGYLATLGICTGLFLHATLSALGISVILATSARAFEILKVLGAAYLVWLGVQALRSGWRGRKCQANPAVRGRKAFLEGLVTNLLNPKVAIFYLAFLPQFIAPSDPVFLKSMLLASVHFLEGVLWLGTLTWFLARILAWLQRPAIIRALDYLSGGMLAGFGLLLLVDSRR